MTEPLSIDDQLALDQAAAATLAAEKTRWSDYQKSIRDRIRAAGIPGKVFPGAPNPNSLPVLTPDDLVLLQEYQAQMFHITDLDGVVADPITGPWDKPDNFIGT